MTERRTPDDIQQPTGSPSLEEVKRLAREADIEIGTTRESKATNLQTRLAERQTHRTEERTAGYEIGEMENIAQQLSARIETEGDERAKSILERNLVNINDIIEKRKNKLKNSIEPKTDQTLGEGEERQKTINALHDEALKEERERNPLDLEDTEVRLAKNAIDNLLAEIAKFIRDDKGEFLRIANDPPRYEAKKRALTVQLESLELQIREIRGALSKKLLFKGKLNQNLAKTNEAKNILNSELTTLRERHDSVVKNWKDLAKQLAPLLQKYAESIKDRNEALKILTDEQVEKTKNERLRIDHRAAKNGIPDDPYKRIENEYPFIEHSMEPDGYSEVAGSAAYIKDAWDLLGSFPKK